MKLASSVPAISIFLLLTTAKNTTVPKETPTAAINLASFHSTIGARDLSSDVSLDPSEPSERSNPSDPSLDVRPPKKPKKEKEPETCSRNSECFWNHICIDGVCVVGCQDPKDCKPPQKCFEGYCHWKAFKKHGRWRKCQANRQNCLRNYHCCYHRCVLPRSLNTNTGIFGYCYKVPRGADGAPGDEWGDIGPDSGDMEELVDSGDTTTTPASLERRELVVEAREFDLEIGENPDEDGLDSELIEKGKTAYWGNY